MSDEGSIGKELEGGGCGLIEILTGYLPEKSK
jgi:hypothetical protein